MGSPEPGACWPDHLPVGALRVVRWSARYDQAVAFYRDIIGLPVLETFHNSYGLDGTILGLPGGSVHLEIVRLGDARVPSPGLDQLVFYLPDAGAWERIIAGLAAAGIQPVKQIDYWQANGGAWSASAADGSPGGGTNDGANNPCSSTCAASGRR